MKNKLYRTAEFSKLSGLSPKALRIYESAKILVPHARAENQYKQYSRDQLKLARHIKTLKSMGFTLNEIRSLIALGSENERRVIQALEQQALKNQEKLSSLRRQQLLLRRLVAFLKAKSERSSGMSSQMARALFCRSLSSSIKSLSPQELAAKTRDIPSTEYLRTLAMIDEEARAKLLSILSSDAAKLVAEDLRGLDKEYTRFWRTM